MSPERRRGLGLEFMGNIWEEITVFLKECKLQFFRLKYMTSWPVFINFKQMLGQRNTLVLALKALHAA
jgi:hypothetical protein